MSDPQRLVDYLRHTAGKAVTYIDGMTQSDFVNDERTQQAVIFNLSLSARLRRNCFKDIPSFSPAIQMSLGQA